MGTNMKKAFTTLLCLLFCITISAQDKAADLSKLVGDWSFSAPDAPYGYQDGSFQIKQENGKLTAKVNIQGSTLEINDIKAKGDTYTSSFYVDGTPVDLTMTQKGNKLEGMADAGGMQIPVEIQENEEVTALWYCEFLLTSRQKLQKDVYSNRNHVLRHCRRVFLS